MKSFLVTYDLRGRDETSADYRRLIESLGRYPYSEKILLSTWIIGTDDRATDVRDHLLARMDSNDRLLVIPVRSGASWRNLMISGQRLKERP